MIVETFADQICTDSCVSYVPVTDTTFDDDQCQGTVLNQEQQVFVTDECVPSYDGSQYFLMQCQGGILTRSTYSDAACVTEVGQSTATADICAFGTEMSFSCDVPGVYVYKSVHFYMLFPFSKT